MINQKIYRVIPDPSAGVFDTPGSWAVLREAPGFRTNLVPNPSAEASGSEGWFEGGSSFYSTEYPVRSTLYHKYGAASFSMVGNDATNQPQIGFWWTPPALGHYVISYWMMKTGNLQSVEFNTGDSGSPDGTANRTQILYRSFNHNDGTTSDWFRFAYGLDVTTLTDKFFRFRGNQYQAGESFVVYYDGFLLEKAEGLADYFDGSYDFAEWHGVPNNSISSINYTRQDFDDFGFTMTALVGGNGPQWNTISTPYALGGGYYQRSTPMMTEFSIVGTIEAQNRIDLERKRRAMQKALSPRLNRPIKLVYEPRECATEDWAKPLVVEAVYLSGLEGNLTNEFQETIAVNFRIHTPWVASDANSNQQDIVVLKSIDVRSGILRRDPQGVYHPMPYTAGATLQARRRGPNGLLYVAYSFAANDVKIYILDEDNLVASQIGALTATSSSPNPCEVFSLRFDPSGDLWIMGNFNTIDGNTRNNLAKWDGSVWTSDISSISEAYATGVANVQDIQWTMDGTAYIVGNFSAINGNARKNFAKYVGGVFTAVSPGLNGAVLDTEPPTLKLVKDSLDTLYIYGRFDGSGADDSRNFWSFAPATGTFSAFVSVGTEFGHHQIYRAIVLQNGAVMMVGDFEEIEGVVVNGVALFQGGNWFRVPELEAYFPMTQISQHPNGIIELGKSITTAYTGGWLQFNGTLLIRPEYRPMYAAFTSFYAVDAYPDGMIYLIGIPDALMTNTEIPETNIVINEGDVNTWPEFLFIGLLNVFNITNATTGVTMHFDLQVNEGEVVTMEIYPQVKLTSTTRGDVTKAVLAGSQTRDFVLVPGENNINFGADAYGETDTRIIISWTNYYDSLGAVFD